MKPASTPSKAGLLIAVLFFLSYLAGYGVIRKDCTPFSPPYYVVPSYLTSSPTLRMIYRPCFLLESRLLENQFIISPWGIMAP